MLENINWNTFFFYVFALITCSGSLAVVFSTNIVRTAVYLIFTLSSTGVLMFVGGAQFVGAMQIMIYVGGTLVLLIFGVMLTAKGPFINMKTRGGEWVLAAMVGSTLFLVMVIAALSVPSWQKPNPEAENYAAIPTVNNSNASQMGLGFTGIRSDRMSPNVNESLKDGMSGYLLPFEYVSVHLLVVLIGAAYLARTKKSRDRVTEAAN